MILVNDKSLIKIVTTTIFLKINFTKGYFNIFFFFNYREKF